MTAGKGKKYQDTRPVHSGSHPELFYGIVDPHVFRASIVIYSGLKKIRGLSLHPSRRLACGRAGTPTHWALQEAISKLGSYKNLLAFPSSLCGFLISDLEQAATAMSDAVAAE
ncbi:MAG: hypothetical protein OSB02_11640 [Rhodospirillaceae bacterium]|nr:hypothetical protein [Rhodospirillaceae bacterium]